ncbi:hypothetical protein HU830_04730 [Lactobacillus sp. DCY120]|uniref:Uncharacterized protein n=1 Tax=Bombilactobacillus apium TaxID=2675299 RepID=A0A850R7H9_9LACO|nr:hypothetical protein [Bombilactobacillus apium]NVY96475.1 hypothetical protein [Bombilactobacillus apium]
MNYQVTLTTDPQTVGQYTFKLLETKKNQQPTVMISSLDQTEQFNFPISQKQTQGWQGPNGTHYELTLA